jgi:polyisoprenoid-binding protein YceI
MTQTRWIGAAVLALLVIAIGGYVAYDQVLRGDSVAPLSFGAASPSTAAGGGGGARPSGESASSGDPLGSTAPGTSATPTDVTATWTVTDGTVVGYRVREKLASLPAQSDAVGRTSSVTGQATVTASGSSIQVTAAQFQADVTTLASDRAMRDNRIRTIGLESNSYPTASFTLTSPVGVPSDALTGATVDVTLVGDLEIHGVRKSVSIPAKAIHTAEGIQILGSLTFPFSDFGMTPPSIGGFVTVENDATLEFLIVLGKS